MCTAAALALDGLATTLACMASDDDLDGEPWVGAVAAAFIACPVDLPFEHSLYEALIGVGGIDVAEPDHLELAAELTTFLLGTGLVTLCCDHQTPTPLCTLLETPDPVQLQRGAEAAASGTFDGLIAYRNQKAVWFAIQASSEAA